MKQYHQELGDKPVLSHGSFEPTHDVVAGFFLIDVKSKKVAIEWVRNPRPHGQR